MDTNQYTIAVKREFRKSAPDDWQGLVKKFKGVKVIGGNDKQLQIEVGETIFDQIKQRIGTFCHIEPNIKHSFKI